MQVEGVGMKPPATVPVIIPDGALRLIAGEAKKQATARKYETRTDSWGKGLSRDMTIGGVSLAAAEAAIFKGKIGEYATAFVLSRRLGINIEPSAQILPFGDGDADLIVVGRILQIKTRLRLQVNLVRVRDERGVSKSHRCDAFVFCNWDGLHTVRILGWQKTDLVLGRREVKAISGNHMNVEILDSELLPFSRLVDELRLCL